MKLTDWLATLVFAAMYGTVFSMLVITAMAQFPSY